MRHGEHSTAPITIAIAGISHETNTFAPETTEIEQFQYGGGIADCQWVEGGEPFLRAYTATNTIMGGAIAAAQSLAVTLLPGFYTDGSAGGTLSDTCARQLVDRLLASLDAQVDGLVLILHGAMVSDTVPDLDGEILRLVRNKLGDDCPIAVVLDLHANMTPLMVEKADIIVGYDTYPHIDAHDRGWEAVHLLVRCLQAEIHPVHALSRPSMLVLPQAGMTSEGPMRQLMEAAFRMEQDPAVLNVFVAGGFPYSDVPFAGLCFVVTTDGDRQLARQYADQLCQLARELSPLFQLRMVPPEEAVQRALRQGEGPVILVEGADNVGGGAPGDGTGLLRYLPDSPKRALIVIRDHAAVNAAHLLGVGAVFEGDVGGKTDDRHGSPVRVRGRIRLLSDGRFHHIGPYMTGQEARMGKTAVIACGKLTLVLTEYRIGPWDQGHVVSLGIRPEDYHIIVVKSALAWRTAFGDICKMIVHTDTPGCCSANLQRLSYRRLLRLIYPLDEWED